MLCLQCDLVDKDILDRYLEADTRWLLGELTRQTGPHMARLNAAMCTLLDDFSLVSYIAIQYGEDLEPKEPRDEDGGDGDGDDGSGGGGGGSFSDFFARGPSSRET